MPKRDTQQPTAEEFTATEILSVAKTLLRKVAALGNYSHLLSSQVNNAIDAAKAALLSIDTQSDPIAAMVTARRKWRQRYKK